MKYCDFNGCATKIERGSYCDDHKRSRASMLKKRKKRNIYHHDNKKVYASKQWEFARTFVYQREKGLCQRCKQFVFGKRAHVHHIIPIKVDATLKYEPNNLKLLCPTCHTIEENEDKKQKVFPSYFLSPPTQN